MSQERLLDPSLASSFDAIADLYEPVQEALPPNTRWYVVGGLATAALRHPSTTIDTAGVVSTTYEADMPALRPNGTVRDVDILVDAVLEPQTVQQAKEAALTAVAGRLEVSLFGFDNAHEHAADKLSFLSRRVMDQEGQRYHQLGPIRQKVPEESYETWTLELPNGSRVPMLHPVGHVLAYRGRSVSGLRPKDTEKFYDMVYKIFDHEPFKIELADGMFAPWNAFTNAVANIRHGHMPPPELVRPGTSRAELRAMRWQGRLLKIAESHPKIVDICQSPVMQKIFSSAVRAA